MTSKIRYLTRDTIRGQLPPWIDYLYIYVCIYNNNNARCAEKTGSIVYIVVYINDCKISAGRANGILHDIFAPHIPAASNIIYESTIYYTRNRVVSEIVRRFVNKIMKKKEKKK